MHKLLVERTLRAGVTLMVAGLILASAPASAQGVRHGDGSHRFGHHGGTHHGHRYYGHHYRHGFHRGYRHHGYGHRYPHYYAGRHYPYSYGGRVYRSYSPRYESSSYGDSRSSQGHDPKSTSDRTDPYDTGSADGVSSAKQHGGSHGWALLSSGQYREALGKFASEVSSHPTKGVPKVGFALASARMGDLSGGIWAMRRALRHDPKALHYIVVDEPLRPQLQQLVKRYATPAQSPARADGEAFMLGALYYLLGDLEHAREAIHRAIESGDDSPSNRNLKRLIDEARAARSSTQ